MPSPHHTHEKRQDVSTFFATAERATPERLQKDLEIASRSPVMDTTMRLLEGWVAVLNTQRQVLTVNQAFLRAIGQEDAERLLGLRPGEVLRCVHSSDPPAGCGTGRHCATCGAAIAIVAAQDSDEVQERECILTVDRDGQRVDLNFLVRCCPFQAGGEKLLLISMRHISQEKRRQALERAFLHDASNILTALLAASDLLALPGRPPRPELIAEIRDSARLLMSEIRIQRLLNSEQPGTCPLESRQVTPDEVLDHVERLFRTHPAAAGQSMIVERPGPAAAFQTDLPLLLRVLSNMVLNALEAGGPGDRIRVWAEPAPEGVAFCVWNRQPVPEVARMRMFQRYHSTKSGLGRGTGTFAMKLLGETLLRGQVSFTTSDSQGTTFRIQLPRSPEHMDTVPGPQPFTGRK